MKNNFFIYFFFFWGGGVQVGGGSEGGCEQRIEVLVKIKNGEGGFVGGWVRGGGVGVRVDVTVRSGGRGFRLGGSGWM